MYKVTLTSQGQITVPVEMREKGNLNPGDKLIIWPTDGRFEMIKDNGWESLKGSLAKYAKDKPKFTHEKLKKIRAKLWTERYRKYLDQNEKRNS